MGSFFDDTVVLFSLFFVLCSFDVFYALFFLVRWPLNSTHNLGDRHLASTSEKYFLFCDLLVRVGSAKNSKKMQKKEEKTLPRRHWHALVNPQSHVSFIALSNRTEVCRTFVSHLSFVGSFLSCRPHRVRSVAGAAVTTITNTLKI
jgi:hypothetical protein